MRSYNVKLVHNARLLRRAMTPEERHLWYDFLKRLPVTVYRQHNIGNYIVDFYITTPKTVVEIDGIQHTAPEHRQADAERDAALFAKGIAVLRYTNDNVRHNFNAVAADILQHIGLSFADLKEVKR